MNKKHLNHAIKCLLYLGWEKTQNSSIYLRQEGKRGYFYSIPKAISIEVKKGRLGYFTLESGHKVPTLIERIPNG